MPNANLALAGTGANRTLTVTPLPNQFGSTFLALVVTDANNLKTTNGVHLFVRAVDDLPTLDPIPNLTAYINGNPVSVPLRGCSAGPAEAGQALRLTARSDNPSIVPHPTVHYTSPNSTGELIVTPSALGTAILTVVADDGDLVSHAISRTFTVTVSDVPLRLTIQRAGANGVVTWPYPASGYGLERSFANTTPWTWTAVVDSPTVSADQQFMTLQAASMEVYRLSKSAP